MAPKKRTTRASPATITTTTTPVTNAQLKALIDQGIADALTTRDADKSMNGDDSHNSGTSIRRQAPLARECTYLDFMKCKPLYFKDTEGVVELTSALTWWNAHVRTVGHDIAYAMTWTNLKKMMTDKYCPSGEIKKLEVEMWNLKVKGTDVVGYNQRFQELALMCARMFPEESDKIEKYVDGLPDMIHGSVIASKPKTMQDAYAFATELMDKKISTLAERQVENKRKLDNNNQAQQQPLKKQGVAIAYTARSGERKEYARTLPLCNKCKFHHNGQCTIKCANCKRVGHLTRDCRSPTATNNKRNLTCYECGNQGYYKSDLPKLKNRNHENQAEGTKARGMVYALGGGETDQDPNKIKD
ncbi:reverse transcriptase domain-containing protein [Tanacetum coccineum]